MNDDTRQASPLWQGKPYYTVDAYLKSQYHEKIYKIALDASLSCPNRDGTVGVGGCIFCSEGGSGDFAVSPFSLSEGKKLLAQKYRGSKYIAYFQAYSGTYGAPAYLEKVYRLALDDPDIAGLSIATRPDCLPREVLQLLARLQKEYPAKFIWLELGLQTIHEPTARFIRRGYSLSCFEEAVAALHALSLPVIVHLILGLPGESKADMLASIDYLNASPVWGVKLQLLYILKHTDLAALYEKDPGKICTLSTKEAYLDVLIPCIEHLRPDMVIHRVTGDAPGKLLIAPAFGRSKRDVLNSLHQQMKKSGAFQGRLYHRN